MARFTHVVKNKRRVARDTEEPTVVWPQVPAPRRADSCTAELVDVIDEVLGEA